MIYKLPLEIYNMYILARVFNCKDQLILLFESSMTKFICIRSEKGL